MAKKRDYYEILGVTKKSTAEEIKKAYRKVAMQYHPDRNPGDKTAEDKFKEAAEAYEILSDADKRARYDSYGHEGMRGMGGQGGFDGMNVEDIFRHFGDIFGGGGFENIFNRQQGGGGQRSGGPRGSNLRIKVKLDLAEIATGTQKKIKVNKYIRCNICNGSGAKDAASVGRCTTCGGAGAIRRTQQTILGMMQTTTTCPTCDGSGQSITAKCTACKGEGRVYGEDNISIDIPAGVHEGIQLSMSGKGNMGERNGPPGDLIITIEEEKHEHLRREGQDLVYTLFVNFADAALGTNIDVPTLTGKVKIKIPPGTQSGKIFRLKGKGLPSLNSYGSGDQLIEVNIWTPKHLDQNDRTILEKIKDMPNFQPNPSKSDKGFFDRVRDFFD